MMTEPLTPSTGSFADRNISIVLSLCSANVHAVGYSRYGAGCGQDDAVVTSGLTQPGWTWTAGQLQAMAGSHSAARRLAVVTLLAT